MYFWNKIPKKVASGESQNFSVTIYRRILQHKPVLRSKLWEVENLYFKSFPITLGQPSQPLCNEEFNRWGTLSWRNILILPVIILIDKLMLTSRIELNSMISFWILNYIYYLLLFTYVLFPFLLWKFKMINIYCNMNKCYEIARL